MAARITSHESIEQVQALLDVVAAASKAGDHEVELEACWAVLAHPCAHHLVDGHEFLDEIHQVLRRLGRFDEAIQAKREAIAACSRSFPDPEDDIAECLVLAGRRAEADALCAELRRRDPDDVWLYNSAGWAFADIDDDEALRWLRDGIDTANARRAQRYPALQVLADALFSDEEFASSTERVRAVRRKALEDPASLRRSMRISLRSIAGCATGSGFPPVRRMSGAA